MCETCFRICISLWRGAGLVWRCTATTCTFVVAKAGGLLNPISVGLAVICDSVNTIAAQAVAVIEAAPYHAACRLLHAASSQHNQFFSQTFLELKMDANPWWDLGAHPSLV